MDESNLLSKFQAYLLDGSHKPGSKLKSELELAERFGVARGTIREILVHFQFIGLLERTRNKGTYVKQVANERLEGLISLCFQVSGFSFEELKEARLQMETAIIPLVVRRMTPEGAERLRGNVEEMLRSSKDAERADALDREFHVALFDLCGNRTLKIFSNVVHLLFRKERRMKFLNQAAAEKSAKDHKRLLEALLAEDVAGAQELLASHIRPT